MTALKLANGSIQDIKTNWKLVLSASIGFSFFSLMISAAGFFIAPLEAEFGWSRTVASSGTTVSNFVTAILGIFAGALIDKYGSRKLVLPGILLTIASITSLYWLTGSVPQWFAIWFVIGIFASSIKSTAWTAAVLGVCKQAPGLVLGLTLAGTAVAQIIVPPLTEFLIESFGWRMAFVWLALGWGSVTFALCYFFFFDAHDQAKAHLKANPETINDKAIVLPGLSGKQAVRSAALWLLGISSCIVMALTIGLSIHMVEILSDTGMDRSDAAWLISLAGVAGIIGKLVTGVLLDKYRPNWVGGLTLMASAAAFALLINGIHTLPLIIFAMLINGYTAGSKTQITGFLTAKYAGMRNFGKVYGLMAGIIAFSAAAGPSIAGKMYDTAGNYDLFLIIGSVGSMIGGVILFSLPAYPNFEEDAAPVAGLS